jgi:hypothetical protein
LAIANATRDWRMYASLAKRLIGIARGLDAEEPFLVDLAETVHALDATTTELGLSAFPRPPFRWTQTAVKRRTLLDLRGILPALFTFPMARCTMSTRSTDCCPSRGPTKVMDRDYRDFERL